MIFLQMWDSALKCLLPFLLQSEVAKGLNFILAAAASQWLQKGMFSILRVVAFRKTPCMHSAFGIIT
jgi:hypothetical protein